MAQTLDNLSYTWNASGTTFTGIKFNVTDTVSASGSLLMDLRVGGVSKFKVTKFGDPYARAYRFNDTGGFLIGTASGVAFNNGVGDYYWGVNQSGVLCVAGLTTGIIFQSGTFPSTGVAQLVGEAAGGNALAQRNGTNAQTFRLYRTYTDGSNYAYTAALQSAANGYVLDSVNAGTAAAPSNLLDLKLNGVSKLYVDVAGTIRADNASIFTKELYSPVSNTLTIWSNWQAGSGHRNTLTFNSEGIQFNKVLGTTHQVIKWGTDAGIVGVSPGVLKLTNASSGGASLEVAEMTAPTAPATNSVRIYAEDDGAGKTRLMALFATGSAVQIAIEP